MRAAAISIMLIIFGMGIMFLGDYKLVKTVGAGFFIVGTIMLALSLYNLFKNK